MVVHRSLSLEAQASTSSSKFSDTNLLSLLTTDPVIVSNHDMLLGLYILITIKNHQGIYDNHPSD